MPAFCADDVTVTVNVAVEPLAMVIGPLTASQPLPEFARAEGVIVTSPEHVPVTLRVKLWLGVAGSEPALAPKSSELVEAAWSEQGGVIAWAVSVTETTTVPTVCFVTLSTIVIVTLPLYVPALRLARFAWMPTAADDVSAPEDEALSQEPPLAKLDQLKACWQSPYALIVAFCVTRLDCPAVPCKANVDGPEIAHGIGVTVSVTLSNFKPLLLVKVSVPLYVPGARPVVLTLTATDAGVAPLSALTFSHFPPLTVDTAAVQLWLVVHPCPAPMLNDLLTGEVPPCGPLKLRLLTEGARVQAGVTVRLT
jgi:hypothetical protein